MEPSEVFAAYNDGRLDHLLKPSAHPETPDEVVEEKPTSGSADLGARGEPTEGQRSREALRYMTPAAIVKPQNEGRLDHLFGRGSHEARRPLSQRYAVDAQEHGLGEGPAHLPPAPTTRGRC